MEVLEYLTRVARPISHPAARDITLDGVLHALADPVRRRIVQKLLAGGRLNCSAACQEALPASTISFHHKILREAGLIRSEKKGVAVINTLRRDDLEKRFPGLLDSILRHQPQTRK
jgi:DNA-binding transcriptional ArsR family regulator